ncbi:MAG: VOC family protein [Pseudomonadota bacterium]
MIGYVTLGTNQFDAAATFYDALLGSIGAGRAMGDTSFIAWGVDPAKPMVSIIKPHDGEAATVGNGTMVALQLPNPAAVDAAHAKAMALGAKDEGAPGPRGSSGFYAAYWRDLDGNKLCFFTMGGA